MKVKDSKALLSSVLTTAQMGQVGIRSTLNTAMRSGLRKALENQLQEYDAIEGAAQAIAASRGWELRDAEPTARGAARLYTALRLIRGGTDSTIAAMMIQGNTRGMISSMKILHQSSTPDAQVATLCQRLLDCENAGIRQMQGFL